MAEPAPAAGWFADPDDPTQLRWWDGSAWTEHRSPAASGPQLVAVPAPAAPPQLAADLTVAHRWLWLGHAVQATCALIAIASLLTTEGAFLALPYAGLGAGWLWLVGWVMVSRASRVIGARSPARLVSWISGATMLPSLLLLCAVWLVGAAVIGLALYAATRPGLPSVPRVVVAAVVAAVPIGAGTWMQVEVAREDAGVNAGGALHTAAMDAYSTAESELDRCGGVGDATCRVHAAAIAEQHADSTFRDRPGITGQVHVLITALPDGEPAYAITGSVTGHRGAAATMTMRRGGNQYAYNCTPAPSNSHSCRWSYK